MFNLVKKKLPLATKFHLTLVVPLILVSIAVSAMTLRGLQNNASHLADVLRIESKTNRILSLLLLQDDASKAMLIDPNQLEKFSAKKIEAYDDHKQLLNELQQEVSSERLQDLLRKLQEYDEQKLRPIDSRVLEKLFENVDQARAMYFDQYEVHKKGYEALIRELAEIGAEDLKKASEELHEKNMRSLLHVSVTLLLGIILITATITLLSRQVERSDDNTRSLLHVLSEGLFFFDSTGRIAEERSQALLTILPGSGDIRNLQDFVSQYAPGASKNVASCLRMLWDESHGDYFQDLSAPLSLLPKVLVLPDQRIIHLEYRPLRHAKGGLERVVVVVADVTQKLQQEKDALLQAERVKKITRAAARTEDYLAFRDEAVEILKRVDAVFQQKLEALNPAGIRQLKHDLHSLKGTLATAEFSYLATEIHNLESLIEDHGVHGASVLQAWEQIKDHWKFETTDIAQVLGLNLRAGRISMIKSKFEKIMQYATVQRDSALQSLLTDCLRQPLQEVFARYEHYLQSTAEKLGKQVMLTFAPDSAELASFEVQKFDAVFNHILHNSVDHGIESPDVRKQLGKPAQGTIQWAAYRKADGVLHFIIRDDGQGVNADKLARKAVQAGLWTEDKAQAATQQQKVELLFLPELSSRDEVTEFSGRGVGMDAVKELVQKLGGTITVFSQAGLGTQFEIDIPPQEQDWDRLQRSA
ncbi:ATP-binding protein [Oligoflexus tunisiensis]|uniref:ATP-binding protein n=1 Tax=Oligoflexus tunisiensis TaxID=708132 RepID=UPI000B243EC8|nr:ATP-binding protein [Oligoflexus tunisiensis]